MASGQLANLKLLIVEDEYFLADDARSVLSNAGAEVLGPVATVTDARAVIEADPAIAGVLLDINLRGEMAFEVADLLRARGTPFVFVTGYDRAALPPRYADAQRLEKPVDPNRLLSYFGNLARSDTMQGRGLS